ncbi:transposase [Isosphaeraceae bacterium EP7]
MDTRTAYPSDLTHAERAQVCRVIPSPRPGGRPAKHDLRDIVDALLYVFRTGCQWRALPHDLPPWATAYWYFPHLEGRQHLRPPDGPAPRRPAPGPRPAAPAVGGHPRQPVGQDDGKRGPRG